jgi:hypothetical protein
VRKRISEELAREQEDWENMVASTGWGSVYVSSLSKGRDPDLEGKNLAQIGEERGEESDEFSTARGSPGVLHGPAEMDEIVPRASPFGQQVAGFVLEIPEQEIEVPGVDRPYRRESRRNVRAERAQRLTRHP